MAKRHVTATDLMRNKRQKLSGAKLSVKREIKRSEKPSRPKKWAGGKKKDTSTPRSKAEEFADSYEVLYEVWGYFGLVPKEWKEKQKAAHKGRTVATWLEKSGTCGWVKYLKWKLAAFFSFHLGQDLPVEPAGMNGASGKTLMGGALGLRARAYMRTYPVVNRKDDDRAVFGLEFVNTVLNSKKGMPRVSVAALIEGEEATKIDLSTLQPEVPGIELGPANWGDIEGDNIVVTRVGVEEAKEQVRRTVREVFRVKAREKLDRGVKGRGILMNLPSTSSSYGTTRSGGGGLGFMLETAIKLVDRGQEVTLFQGLRTPGGPLKLYDAAARHELVTVAEHWEEKLGDGGPSAFVYAEDTDDEDDYLSGWGLGGQRAEESVLVADDRELTDRLATLFRRAQKYALNEEALAQPVGLAEPLKIRTILKGPAVLYYAVRPIWKELHSMLKTHKQFSLIGEPDNAETLQKILGAPSGIRNWFLSGDYKGATNNLHPEMSRAAAEEIAFIMDLDELETKLFIKSLLEHVIISKGDDKKFKQVWGQSMGSISSFPILCIVNAAATRWALEIHENRDIPLRELNAAFNGDDVAARTTEGAMPVYERVTKAFGLSLSIGKTFIAKEFFTINSRSYLILDVPEPYQTQNLRGKETTRHWHFRKSKFVNMGILNGMKRSSEAAASVINDLDDSSGFSPATRSEAIVEDTPDRLLSVVYGEFLRKNKEQFKATRLPWFIPRWMGGLGLAQVRETDKSSELDLRIAKKILLDWNIGQKPVNLFKAEGTWRIRKLATERLPEMTEVIEESEGVRASQKLVQLAQLNLLFDSNLSMTDLIGSAEEIRNPLKDAVNINRKLWDPRQYGNLPEPIDERVIMGMKTYDAMQVVFESDVDDSVSLNLSMDLWRKPESTQTRLVAEEIRRVPELGDLKPTCKEAARFFERYPEQEEFSWDHHGPLPSGFFA